MKLTNQLNFTAPGRILLHVECMLKRPSNWHWHWEGIKREIPLHRMFGFTRGDDPGSP